jgi:hypothetical protein
MSTKPMQVVVRVRPLGRRVAPTKVAVQVERLVPVTGVNAVLHNAMRETDSWRGRPRERVQDLFKRLFIEINALG